MKLVLTFFLSMILATSSESKESLLDNKLIDFDGKEVKLESIVQEKKFLVVIAQGLGCPIVRKYSSTFNRTYSDYKNKDVAFVMINGVLNDDVPTLKKEIKNYDVQLPVYIDKNQETLKELKLKVLSAVALVEIPSQKILYRGAIDDRITLDVTKKQASKNYLTDALNSALQGKTINVPESTAHGCSILIK